MASIAGHLRCPSYVYRCVCQLGGKNLRPSYISVLLTNNKQVPCLLQRSLVSTTSQKPVFTNMPSNDILSSSVLSHVRSQEYHSSALPPRSILQRVKEGLGIKEKMRYKGTVLQKSGIRVYLCCVELIDYEEFFSVFNLPDTFNSWFRITELHVWMAMVRLKSEGMEGEIIRNNMLKHMWEDVENRTKKLGGVAASSRSQGVNQLNAEFRASIFAYDEGLLSNDKVLAGTVWRNFFEMQCEDPEKLANMVGYIRKQMQHIDNQETEEVLGKGILTFLPVSSEKLSATRSRQILEEIFKRT